MIFTLVLDWGIRRRFRRARFDPIEGLMYLMPMDRSGGVDAAICLSDEDLERLRCDKEFMHYGKWIG